MNPDERDEMNRLCQLIQDEQDRPKFMELVQRLLDLLARKRHRLEAKETRRT